MACHYAPLLNGTLTTTNQEVRQLCPPRKAVSVVFGSSFNVKMLLISDKTVALAASTLVSLAAAVASS